MRLRGARVVLGAALLAILAGGTGAAQAPPARGAQAPPPGSVEAAAGVERTGESATLTYANRPIVVLRARVLGRGPAERVVLATRVLDDLVRNRTIDPVESRPIDGGALISVQSRVILALTSADIDEGAGESLPELTTQTVSRLQQALREADEARQPVALLIDTVLALVGLSVGLLILWAIGRARRGVSSRLATVAEKTIEKTGIADKEAIRRSRLLDYQRGAVTALTLGLQLVVLYGIVSFVLRRFPYTRPWGEALRGFLVDTVGTLGMGVINAIPGVFTVVLIFVVARVLTRLLGLWFDAVELGRVRVRWIYPETALPTRRIGVVLVWVFAVVVAYPYMPGSGTDAFKGVSVLLGVMLSLGSSGLVNQVMSGLMITYSRAVRAGDFVRIGDVEGTVVHLGVLSTKVRTLMREEVTIPNAVVVSKTTTDYSRLADTEGVLTPVAVTIGYDAPWRQVHAMLLLAAERTAGLKRTPKPHVLQTALEDFYVRYTLYVSLVRQVDRLVTLDALQANIQDVFNEYGVQIMSPNYLTDPSAPKVVPKKDWFAAPARTEPGPTGE
jgi:small-conductance mechanosensitive channel